MSDLITVSVQLECFGTTLNVRIVNKVLSVNMELSGVRFAHRISLAMELSVSAKMERTGFGMRTGWDHASPLHPAESNYCLGSILG